MTQTCLKMRFYMVAGILLASITWSSIEHSVVSGDDTLGIVVMGLMFFIIGKFFVDRWRPVYGADAFHPDRLWKIPQMATRRELWYRVGFSTFVGATTFTSTASVLFSQVSHFRGWCTGIQLRWPEWSGAGIQVWAVAV